MTKTKFWLPQNQHGFRRGNSCANNFANLSLTIESTFKEHQNILAAFIVVERAFNFVNIDLLIGKLANSDCTIQILQFNKFITYERHIFTQNSSSHYLTYRGVPQEAVLSPLLYNIYTSSIFKSCQTKYWCLLLLRI